MSIFTQKSVSSPILKRQKGKSNTLQGLAQLFYNELLKLHQNETLDDTMRFSRLYELINAFFVHLTRKEKLQFSTQFARIAFACHKHDLPNRTQWYIHEFRKQAKKVLFRNQVITEAQYWLGMRALADAIEAVTKIPIPATLAEVLPEENFYQKSAFKVKDYKALARVVVLEIDEEAKILLCQDEDVTEEQVKVRYDVTAVNENFNATIQGIRKIWKHQPVVNLLEVQIDENRVYYPKIFVVEPDYLVDVSAVAGCFSHGVATPMLYLLRKFLPFDRSIPLVVGNIANFFLDELMNNTKARFNEIFPMVFRLNPLGFTLFENQEIRQVMQQSQRHFASLKQMVLRDFRQNDIEPSECYLEPSFFSEQYGLQGRLDIWYENKANRQNSAIVELKSGRPFMPNIYGISEGHYIQALLYDLLIKSVFNQKDPRNYILYSKLEINHLKFAPAVKAKQNEAIQTRNHIVALEQALVNLHEKKDKSYTLLDRLRPERYPKLKGFIQRDLQYFSKVLSNISTLERQYFLAFVSFTAREHQLSKTGVQGLDTVNGLASLWLNHFQEKNENFEIISHLCVEKNQVKETDALLTFAKTADKTNNLANFRQGDIAVLYPCDAPEKGETALQNQIFKCTVTYIDSTKVVVRLRYKQFNDSIFEDRNRYWILEHDVLDHSFNFMYRSLFAFLQFPKDKKTLLLAKRPPRKPMPKDLQTTLPNFKNLANLEQMTKEQQRLLQKALLAEEYFLLWGPPGTGKTSMMLKNLVAYLHQFTNENILLLAYTNRAVDEICEAVESIGTHTKSNYIRIGSRYSTNSVFHHALFETKIQHIKRRSELKTIIDKHRIFIATVASIGNKLDLLQLKTFNRVIIDEASQILEPVLMGLLPRFKQFILIGDHKQLPAVVVQDKERSKVYEKSLQNIGLNNLRDSLFERLFLQCRKNNWDTAYDMLSHQGRMHTDIMAFPNQFFYENNLKILPYHCGVDQESPLMYNAPMDSTPLQEHLLRHRFVYIPTARDDSSRTTKTNIHEAEWIARLVDAYCRIYIANNRPIDFQKTIGIITPYRAQIAQIRDALHQYHRGYENFSVDTVERYQGSAREIILISLCINNLSQLETLVSLDTAGQVDRKLNVALTRARKHLVVLGNKTLMQQSSVYEQLVKFVTVNGGYWEKQERVGLGKN